MWGVIGFVSAAACISLFAATTSRAFVRLNLQQRTAFCTAFYLLAINMLLWAGAILVGSAKGTMSFMLASDAVLLLATGYMLYVLFAAHWRAWFVLPVASIGAMLLALRAYDYMPQASIRDGLLYFNLQPDIRLVTLLLFLGIWLPAVITVARQGGSDPALPGIQNGIVTIFMAIIFATAVFLSTQRPVMIIAAFAGIVLLFASAATVNFLIIDIHNKGRTARAAKR